jgi:hypothetical protein
VDGVFEDLVRQRAYEIWNALGRADGQAHDHWFAAEQHLLTQAKPKKARASAIKAKPTASKALKAAAPAPARPKKSAQTAQPSGASA